MKKLRQELWSHGVLLLSAFAMLAAVTAAWFIQNQTARVSPMSFAAQNSGGATLFKTLEENGVTDRAAATVDGVLRITNTAHWKSTAEPLDSAAVTVENFLPGQIEYFYILANSPTSVTVTNIAVTRSDGPEAQTADCVGLYLYPVADDTPPAQNTVATDLVRRTTAEETPPLAAAYFWGQPAGAMAEFILPPVSGAEKTRAYILAVACDPLYGQDQETNALGGTVSFSLQFDAATAS